MTDEIAPRREDQGSQGRYVIDLPGGVEAELTFIRGADGAMIANHTYVPPTHRGRGIAEKLVAAAVADARRDGIRIVPVCSFVAAQFRRHPDWADLRV